MRNEKDSPRNTIPDVQEIVRRAESGDESALLELRSILDDCPEIWREASNLEAQTREMWINLMASKDLFRRETMQRRIAEMRWELAGPDSSELEWLLVDRILCAWLAMIYSNAMCVRHQTGADAMFRLILKQQNAAERHIQSAIKQLMTIRQLVSSPTNTRTIKLPTLLTDPTTLLKESRVEIRNPKDDDPLLQAGKARVATRQQNEIDAEDKDLSNDAD